MKMWTPASAAVLALQEHEALIRHFMIEPDRESKHIVLCASYDKDVIRIASEHYSKQGLAFTSLTVAFFRNAPELSALVVPRRVGGYIGVDLDGTLAHYTGWNDGVIGNPIPRMSARIWDWLGSGQEVRIVTARVGDIQERERVYRWLWDKYRLMMPVQNTKTFRMHELWDDRAIQVMPNTGRTLREHLEDNGK